MCEEGEAVHWNSSNLLEGQSISRAAGWHSPARLRYFTVAGLGIWDFGDAPLVVAGSEAGDADGCATVSDGPLERVDFVGLRLAGKAAVVALAVPVQGSTVQGWGHLVLARRSRLLPSRPGACAEFQDLVFERRVSILSVLRLRVLGGFRFCSQVDVLDVVLA